MNKAEKLIACLEGEIAKRDETIARLEPQLNRAIQANYDLREELAACRVAVENCEVFRARIAELTAELAESRKCAEIMQQGAFAYQAELAALREQKPIKLHNDVREYLRDGIDSATHCEEGDVDYEFANGLGILLGKLYAAPVSEAKSQGVVQWPEADEIMQMAFEEGQPADDASGYCFELEEFDLFIERLMSEVANLNAATVQQVSVPDGFRVMNPTSAVVRDGDRWEIYAPCGSGGIVNEADVTDWVVGKLLDAIAAAPAAPAADAGLVLEQAMYALIGIGYHENSGLVHELRQSLAAHRSTGVA